ncbi:MAG: PAAR-like domain-containing protein [Planctomycetota bacterium]
MGQTVFANSRGVAHRGTGAPALVYPDICMTPIPGGPVPIPYPNIAASEGARTGVATKAVKVSGKGVPAKGAVYKSSTGNEPGTAATKGVISHRAAGKASFNTWSGDVKLEGKNAVRHLGATPARGGPRPVASPAARRGLAVSTGPAAQEPAAKVNAPPPVPCGNPNCRHHTARVPATQTAQLPAEKAQEHGLLGPIVCLECYRMFAGLEPRPAATTQAAAGG